MENHQQRLWQIYQSVYFFGMPECIERAKTYALISVWNAFGKVDTRLHNKKLENRVCTLLNTKKISHKMLWAGNNSMSFRERTAILCVNAINQADSLARFAKQNAYYIIKQHQLYLVETGMPNNATRLRHFKLSEVTRCERLIFLGDNQAIAE